MHTYEITRLSSNARLHDAGVCGGRVARRVDSEDPCGVDVAAAHVCVLRRALVGVVQVSWGGGGHVVDAVQVFVM
jgi:hypothetical protein